jgi:hypothetical protein
MSISLSRSRPKRRAANERERQPTRKPLHARLSSFPLQHNNTHTLTHSHTLLPLPFITIDATHLRTQVDAVQLSAILKRTFTSQVFTAGRRTTLTPPDPQLEGRMVPAWFQPLHLSSENPVSKFAFKMGQLAPLQRGGTKSGGGILREQLPVHRQLPPGRV